MSLITKHSDKYTINAHTGCWDWQLSMVGGYPHIKYERKTISVVKLFCEEVGKFSSEGTKFLRACGNKRCVNPDHMQVVSDRAASQKGAEVTLGKTTPEERRDWSRKIRESMTPEQRLERSRKATDALHPGWREKTG
jgi:hypothetical protein